MTLQYRIRVSESDLMDIKLHKMRCANRRNLGESLITCTVNRHIFGRTEDNQVADRSVQKYHKALKTNNLYYTEHTLSSYWFYDPVM